MFTTATHFVVWDWYRSAEGQQIISTITNRSNQKRKVFGILERPSFPPQMVPDEFQYKIFVSGKSGVGKTSTVAKLTANQIPEVHNETPGIQTSTLYWPAKMSDIDKVVMFQLQFWDAGESALKKFDHILPACKERMDGVMLLFSFTDKASFEDLPHHVARIMGPDDNASKFVIGTKLDQQTHCEITQRQISDFEHQWKVPIVTLRNTTESSEVDLKTELNEIAPILNYICDQLWLRDQILAGRIQSVDSLGQPKISPC